MKETDNRVITSCCTDTDAEINLPFETSVITKELGARLEESLTLNWVDESESPELLVRVVKIDQGNQFLRWLLPFIAPATLEVKGHITIGDAAPQQFHHVKNKQVGFLGGSAEGMLKACARRVAAEITSDVRRYGD